MSDTNSPDKLARIIAAISLLVSIVTAGVSYIQQNSTLEEQKRQFQILQKEGLVIRLNPNVGGAFKLTDTSFGSLGRLVQISWGLTVSNIGNQKLSITKYLISTGDSPGAFSYSGIDGGILGEDGTAVKLPLILESGESRMFLLQLGVFTPGYVYKVLSSIDKDKLLSPDIVRIELARKGFDSYGNKVEFQEFPGGGYILTVDKENQKSPIFWLEATTGRGNTFEGKASTYQR